MGPLWAWVILWLVSAYGLVMLLRNALTRSAVESVPVLVATPKPVEPPPAEPEANDDIPPLEGAELTVSVSAPSEEEPVLPPDHEEGLPEPPMPSTESGEGAPEAPRAPEAFAVELEDVASPTAENEPDDVTESPASVEGDEALSGTDDPWIKEKEGVEASDPWVREAEEALSITVSDEEPEEDGEAVVYRSIDLEGLTLGLAATDIQSLYGPPGHMSKLGEDGEQWRYPLNATDEQGHGIEGVLVLEFQRGRLVRKALEENEADV